ncbi:MAG: transglycosylase domain-containing protein [Lachnospiraceae bacterium]|nr:transglycosylase domain-containing protein [Lachnospiraceae bacterium]MEE3460791.1 transglycosylase domain-containing protein [Lachnospiraceae bacterium]
MNFSKRNIRSQLDLLSLEKRKKLNSIYVILLIVCFFAFISFTAFSMTQAFFKLRTFLTSLPDSKSILFLDDGKPGTIYDTSGRSIGSLTRSYNDSTFSGTEEIPDKIKKAFAACYDPDFYKSSDLSISMTFDTIYNTIVNNSSSIRDFADPEDTPDETAGTDKKSNVMDLMKLLGDVKLSIPEQLVANQLYFRSGQDNLKLNNFMKEQFVSLRVQQIFKKDEIIGYFLNTLCFGNDITGITDAAEYYFSKDVSELTVSEASVLAAISVDSEIYDPFLHPDKNKLLERRILKFMHDNGMLDETGYEDELGSDPYGGMTKKNPGSSGDGQKEDSYTRTLVISLKNDLMDRLGYSETQALNAIYHGGLNIYSCEDSYIQKHIEELINDDKYYKGTEGSFLDYSLTITDKTGTRDVFTEDDLKDYFEQKTGKKQNLYFDSEKDAFDHISEYEKYLKRSGRLILDRSVSLTKEPQCSAVLMDHNTGEVAALIGGRDQSENTGINHANDVLRSPGTALTPFAVYVPALDASGLTLSDVEDDVKTYFPEDAYEVKNINGAHYGLITMRNAMLRSDNVAAVKFFSDIQYQTGIDYLKKFGFKNITALLIDDTGKRMTDLRSRTAIGDLWNGTSNLELTAAYAALASKGRYHQPLFYRRAAFSNGEEVIKNTKYETRIINIETAWLIDDVLNQKLNNIYKEKGIGSYDHFECGQDSADYRSKNKYFNGFNKKYSLGLWAGNDDESRLKNGPDLTMLWHDIMAALPKYDDSYNTLVMKCSEEDRDHSLFKKPDTIISARVCTKSGKLGISGICDDSKVNSTIVDEYFVKGTEPDRYCDRHVVYNINKKTGFLSNPENIDTEKKIFLIKDDDEMDSDTPYILPEKIKEQIRLSAKRRR